jgi:hypothetical protein
VTFSGKRRILQNRPLHLSRSIDPEDFRNSRCFLRWCHLLDLSSSSTSAHAVAFSASLETMLAVIVCLGEVEVAGLWFCALRRPAPADHERESWKNVSQSRLDADQLDGWMGVDVDPRRELNEWVCGFLGGRGKEKHKSSLERQVRRRLLIATSY